MGLGGCLRLFKQCSQVDLRSVLTLLPDQQGCSHLERGAA